MCFGDFAYDATRLNVRSADPTKPIPARPSRTSRPSAAWRFTGRRAGPDLIRTHDEARLTNWALSADCRLRCTARRNQVNGVQRGAEEESRLRRPKSDSRRAAAWRTPMPRVQAERVRGRRSEVRSCLWPDRVVARDPHLSPLSHDDQYPP